MFQISRLWRPAKPIDDLMHRRASETISEPMHWDTALRILQTLDPRLPTTARNASQVSAGVAAPLEGTLPEERAFEIQLRVLEYAIQLRKTVHSNRELDPKELPRDQRSEKDLAHASAKKRAKASESKPAGIVTAGTGSPGNLDGTAASVREFIARIQDDTIRSAAQNEIVADYWNKLAFVAWERATLDGQVDTKWLQLARQYIEIVKAGRPNWSPSQLNEARILDAERKKAEAERKKAEAEGKKAEAEGKKAEAEGKKAEALDTLAKVLGKKKDAQVTSAVKPAASQPDSITNAIPKAEDKPQHSYADVLRDLSTLVEASKGNLTQLNYDEFHRGRRKARFARDREHNRSL
jgi:hypothetical protein